MTAPRSLIAGLLGALASIASAQAADMPGTWAPPPEMVPKFTEMMSGWYLRLDGGYSWNKVGSVDAISPVTTSDYKSAPDASVGFGFKYRWLRFELTFDRGFPSNFNGSTSSAVAQPQYSSKVGWMAAYGNAYVDLGTWWGFTPYVGGGIGASRINSKSYSDTSLIFNAKGSPESQATNFSWNAMAGIAFQIDPSWVVDVGFRHVELGKVFNTTASGTPYDFATYNRISANQARIGIRFLFD